MLEISQGRSSVKNSRFMDSCVKAWQRVGLAFKTRPATLIGLLLGTVIFASSLAYVLVRQGTTENRLNEVTAEFCSGQNPDPQKCQQLLDALLRNPTPEQARRLREIVDQP